MSSILGTYYVVTRYTDKGKVSGEIYLPSEVEDLDTTPYTECEGYDRYCDPYNSIEEAEEALREALEA